MNSEVNVDGAIDGLFANIADISEAIVFFSLSFDVPGADGVAHHNLPLILVWLAFAALFFTVYFGFINLRYFKHAIDIVRGKHKEAASDGQITPFRALATSLSGTVGLGNIAGVAVAVSIGGPGAVLWMMLMGLFSMSTKFVEVTLGVKYRHHADKHHPEKISGGPMYYLRDAFANRNIPYLGALMAGLFAVCCIGGAIGGGNMFQANQSFAQLVNVTGGTDGWLADKGWLYGTALAFLVGLVIIGGIKSIASVASRVVPIMGGVYVLAGLLVIALNFQNIPAALGDIFTQALTPTAGLGGFIGGLLVGIQRAVFSNEAGIGSAPIVHSTAQTDIPVKQGFVGMLGPFIDTVIICMVTALVIVITGAHVGGAGIEGVELTSRAFATAIPGADFVLAFTVFLFAYSTMITWSYYGVKATTYLFGERDWLELAFKILFCLFVIVGASSDLENVIRFSDAMLLSMAIPNIIGLYLLAPEVRRDLRKYIQDLKGKKEGLNSSAEDGAKGN